MIVTIFAIGIVTIWIVMQQSTNSIVSDIENAVRDDTYYAITDSGLTMEERSLLDENQVEYEEYRWDQIFDYYWLYYSSTRQLSIEEYLDGYVIENFDVHRTYALHNFSSGYVWVVVHFDIVDKNGNELFTNQGGPDVGTKFKIEKHDGKWKITDFYEQNSWETDSERIYYLLPNWDLTKQ